MKLPDSKFKFVDRGELETLVLIPGWATDFRIFEDLDLKFNYLLPVSFSPFNFSEGLLPAMKENRLRKVSLFGWSLGGFVASDFAAGYKDKVKEVILLSVRKRYEREAIEKVRAYVKGNRKGYLYKFYLSFFSEKERESFLWFKKHLLNDYLFRMKSKALFAGLDYLLEAQLNPQDLQGLRLKFIHGREDAIVPVSEVSTLLKDVLPHAEYIFLKDAGHIPFMAPNFRKVFYGEQGG